MSNPFLKQKNTNNRFNSLISDKPDIFSKNSFSHKQQTDVVSKKNLTKKQFVLEEEFPLLCETQSSPTTSENTCKFKDAVNMVIPEEIIEEVKVLPKWVSYSRQNGTTIINQGSYILEKIKKEHEQQILDNSPNTLMKHITDKLQKNWEQFRIDYDLIYGEGSYNQEYILPPVYGPEYENDDDDYYDDNSSNEYNDNNEYLEEYME